MCSPIPVLGEEERTWFSSGWVLFRNERELRSGGLTVRCISVETKNVHFMIVRHGGARRLGRSVQASNIKHNQDYHPSVSAPSVCVHVGAGIHLQLRSEHPCSVVCSFACVLWFRLFLAPYPAAACKHCPIAIKPKLTHLPDRSSRSPRPTKPKPALSRQPYRGSSSCTKKTGARSMKG